VVGEYMRRTDYGKTNRLARKMGLLEFVTFFYTVYSGLDFAQEMVGKDLVGKDLPLSAFDIIEKVGPYINEVGEILSRYL
jgi:hypothetical protein